MYIFCVKSVIDEVVVVVARIFIVEEYAGGRGRRRERIASLNGRYRPKTDFSHRENRDFKSPYSGLFLKLFMFYNSYS